MIYIDPPYNTGNKDFKYNDNFVDREDAYRHSKWLSFLHKRLLIAKRLLSEKGVIFISIDDNEQAQLKLLCDEIFDSNNFIDTIIWEKNDSPKMDSKLFSTKHDYILCYGKNILTLPIKPLIINSEEIVHYNKVDKDGNRYYIKPLRAMGGQGETREARPNLYYAMIAPDGTEVYPKRKDGTDGAWRWSKEKTLIEDERIEWTKGKKGYSPNFKIFAEKYSGRPPETIWYHHEVGSNRTSKSELNLILEETNLFNSPKPIALIKKIMKISGNKNSIVFDFFAGSGTTLHATILSNAEDRGSRQCILVTNNENNICEEVTYERNKRVIAGYTNAKGVQVPGLANNNLRYYKTGFVPSAKTEVNRRLLTSASTELLQIKEDCYIDITTLNGFDATKCGIYSNEKGKYLIVVYHSRQQNEVAEHLCDFIRSISDLSEKVRVYAFSPETETLAEDFYPVADKVNAVPLPDAIYNAYRATFKTLKLEKKVFSATSTESEDEHVAESESSSQSGLFEKEEE